jgi:hypothetical protein
MPDILEKSAHLVKVWGESKLPDGKTLAEKLTLQGIPLWETIAVDLALYLVPQALSLGDARPSYFQRIKPYLSRAKHETRHHFVNKHKVINTPDWPPEKTMLFLGFNGYFYRDVLQPVVSRLSAHQHIQTKSLYDHRASIATAEQESQNLQSIWQYCNNDILAHSGVLRKLLQKTWVDLLKTQVLPRIIENQGQSLWPQMEPTFKWLFWSYLPFLLPQAAIAHHILEQHRPALIVTPDVADPRTRLYCIMGRQRHIPSLEVQFGACGPEAVEWQFFVTDYLAVWGMQARDLLLRHGVPEERIKVTGSPRHDSLASVSESEKSQARLKLCIPQKNIFVLFASAYNQKSYNAIADPEVINKSKRAVFQAVNQVDGVSLIVKPHPLEDVKETKQMASESSNIQFVDQRSDIRTLIKACDVFISLGTAATLDALILNKLVICPIFPGWAWGDLFVKDGATLVPHSVEDIIDILRRIVNGSRESMRLHLEPARQKFINKWVYQVDGQSAARIEALSFDIVNGEGFK